MRKELYAGFRKQLDFSFHWKKLFQHFAIDLLFIASIVGLFSIEGPAMYFAMIPISFLIFRNFGLMHEAVHNQAHPHHLVNSGLGLISGCLCLLPFYLWKKIHLEHHFWTGNVDKDPTLAIVKRHPTSSKHMQAWMTFCWRARIPFAAFMQHVVFWEHATRLWIRNIKSPMYWAYLFVPVACWTGIILMLNAGQLGVLAGALALYLYMVEAINFPHHAGAYIEPSSAQAKLPVWEQHHVARSCVYPKWFQSWVLLHFNYHIEHHTFPDLPWHQLDKAHQLMTDTPEVKAEMIIIGHSWLESKRQGSFGDFVLPPKNASITEIATKRPKPEAEKKSAA